MGNKRAGKEMTAALSLLELPASREHEQIETKEELAIDEEVYRIFGRIKKYKDVKKMMELV